MEAHHLVSRSIYAAVDSNGSCARLGDRGDHVATGLSNRQENNAHSVSDLMLGQCPKCFIKIVIHLCQAPQ